MTYTFPLPACTSHTFQWEDGQHSTCYRCGTPAKTPTTTPAQEATMTSNAPHADITKSQAQMLASLTHTFTGEDPAALATELYASRGTKTMNNIIRHLSSLSVLLEAEYRASEEAAQ